MSESSAPSLVTGIERAAPSTLIPHPQNPHQGDVGAISESLRLTGQYRPIVVQRSTRYVLAGNHTMRAAEALGWPDIEVAFVDVDDETATRILLADNRTAALGYDDPALLVEILEAQLQSALGLDGTGYDGDDLDALLLQQRAVLHSDSGIPPSVLAGFHEPRKDAVCPECGAIIGAKIVHPLGN